MMAAALARCGSRCDFFDRERARHLEAHCRYYNREVHEACFALPTFARQVCRGENPFEQFDEKHRQGLAKVGSRCGSLSD